MAEFIGGQAVIEGVMMKAGKNIAVAVRKPDGKVETTVEPWTSKTERFRILRAPILRGMVTLVEMLVIGYKALNWSANQQLDQEEQITMKEMVVSVLISLLFGIGIFVVAPYWLSTLVHDPKTLQFHVFDGILRLMIFLLYLVILGFLPDIKRLFQYHGAEHKTVNCVEAKLPLTVANVKRCPKEHLRCGTSLIFAVVALSIFVFSTLRTPWWYANVLLRILFIPIIGGISYELIRLSAKRPENILLRVLITPGLWIQSLTVNEPDNKQIEVAIASIKAAQSE